MPRNLSAPFFSATPVFRRADYARAVGRTSDDKTVTAMLSQHVRAGNIKRVARGLYASVPKHADSKSWWVDRLLVGLSPAARRRDRLPFRPRGARVCLHVGVRRSGDRPWRARRLRDLRLHVSIRPPGRAAWAGQRRDLGPPRPVGRCHDPGADGRRSIRSARTSPAGPRNCSTASISSSAWTPRSWRSTSRTNGNATAAGVGRLLA